jgi:hypothetical protein
VVSAHHTRPVLISFAAFVLLTLAQTWPIASAPAHWSRVEGDGALNVWAIGWVGHALTHEPAHLFDANIFYPEKRTLAFSEAMLVQGAIGAPIMAAGGSAVLAYNIALVAGLALTGWAFCLLVHYWTGNWPAGFVAGSLAAFNAFTLVQLTHLQFLHAEFFALILFAFDRVIAAGKARHAGALAAGVALQALTSIYLMVFTVWMLVFACVARGRDILSSKRTMLALAAAAGLAAVLLAPYIGEYAAVREGMGFSRSADEEEAVAVANYLSTGARVHYAWWSHAFAGPATSYTFPGVIAVVLMALALSDRATRSDARFRMCVVIAGGCIAVSAAPLLPFYPVLHAYVPLFQAVRVLPHIGEVVLLMVAVLAGFGVAAMPRWLHGGRLQTIAGVTLVLLVNVEATRAPLGLTWFDRVPAVYDVLARERGAIIAEAPFPIPQQWFLNGPYMVNSTRHWRPLLNGYSGFRPASYEASYEAVRSFPSDESLLALSKLGVTHVVVHQRAMNHGEFDDRYDPYRQVASLHLITRDDDVLIYELLRR